MSIGVLNNKTYNQSQNWSGITGGQNVDSIFDEELVQEKITIVTVLVHSQLISLQHYLDAS